MGVIVVETVGSTGVFAVSSTDLLQGLTPVKSGNGNFEAPSDNFAANDPAVLTDGIFGSANPNADTNAKSTLAVGNNVILDYTLASSGPGITLESVTTYGGWQDNGRDAQRYSLFYSTVAAPGVFSLLTVVNYEPNLGSPSNSRVTISDSTGILATGVGVLRFDFGTNQENNYAGYREFDAQAVPEPGSALLLSAGALGLAIRRRRSA
jgi:hypothetical protein